MKTRHFTAKILFQAHSLFGLTAGLYYVLLGLSGSYIVYSDTFQNWIAPEVRTSSGHTQSVALAPLVAAAQKGLNLKIDPLRIELPENETANAKVMFNVPKDDGKRRMINAFIDPVNFEFKGSEDFRETLSGKIFIFHHDLFLGQLGRTIMGVFGLMMLAILLTGVYLTWPKRRQGLKGFIQVFRLRSIRNFALFNRETHRFLGVYSLALMILVTFSGVYISKPGWFQSGSREGRREGGRDGGRMAEKRDLPLMDFSKVEPEFQILKRPSKLRIDPKEESVSLEASQEDSDEPKTFAQNQRAWHGGHFFGRVGLFLIFLSGLLPLYFYITGFILWRKRHAHESAA